MYFANKQLIILYVNLNFYMYYFFLKTLWRPI